MYLDNFYCSTNINTESLFFSFFSIEKHQETYNKVEQMTGIFYQIPVIIVFIFTMSILVPRMSWQPHSSKSLSYIVTKLQVASVAVKFAILFINRTGAYH